MNVLLLHPDAANPGSVFSSNIRDNLATPWIYLKRFLLDRSIHLYTLDNVKCTNIDVEIHLNVQRSPSTYPRILIALENPYLLPDNYKASKLSQYTKIISFSPQLYRLKNGVKAFLPHHLSFSTIDGLSERDNLICMFAANKSTTIYCPSINLYKRRVDAIRWYSQNHPSSFNLYGNGWNLSPRLPTRLGGLLHKIERLMPPFVNHSPCTWRGSAPSKESILKSTKFSFAFENVSTLGYISEKIFDSMVYGCIPVYLGPENISDYIPSDCFIDFYSFGSFSELHYYLESMTEDQFNSYQVAIANFINSNQSYRFSMHQFSSIVADTLLSCI